MLAPLLAPDGFNRIEARFLGGVAALSAQTAPGVKRWFLLDTGAPGSVYNGKLPEGWPGPTFKIGGINYGFPTQQYEGFVAAAPDGGKTTVEGVVGCDFLKNGQVLFDADKGEVWMRMNTALTPTLAERALRDRFPDRKDCYLATLPLEWDGKEGRFRAAGKVGATSFRWVLDTGATYAFLTAKIAEGMNGVSVGTRTVSKVDGPAEVRRWLIPGIAAGSTRLVLPVIHEETSDTDEEAVLGMAALSRNLLIDLPGRTAYWLEPTESAARLDLAVGALFGVPVRTISGGRMVMAGISPVSDAVDPTEILAIQDEPVESVRRIATRAAAGDAKALSRLVELRRDRDKGMKLRARWQGTTMNVGSGYKKPVKGF